MLILSAQDLRQALPMRAAIDTQKQAYIAVATGGADLPLRTPVRVPEQDAVTLFMPANVAGNLGAKIVSVFPKNVAAGRPMIHGVVVMVDTTTGEPSALLDATYLTALRTAAGSGAATEALARSDSHILALIGSGTLARTHLLAMCEVRPITEARIYSRNANHIAALIDEMQPQVQAKLIASPDAAAAIQDADIICCATTATSPVIEGRHLRPGAHVNGVGSYTLQMQEIDGETLRRAGKAYVDSRESVLAEAGELVAAIQSGALTESSLVEIGAVLNGQPGRNSAQALTVFKSCGLAAQDVVAAGAAIRRAKELGLGVEVKL